MTELSRREHLIEVATTLFLEHGFHATGIDKILQVAGVSKKTMYQYFRSKDELIYAVLRRYDGVYRNGFMKAVEESGKTPRARLEAIFAIAEVWFADHKFFGCMFINVIGEYSEEDSPIRDICKQFKQHMRQYVENLAREAHADDAPTLAEELCLLLEGAIVTAQVQQNPNAAKVAAKIGMQLINQHIPHSTEAAV